MDVFHTLMIFVLSLFVIRLARVVGIPVGRRSGGRLAMMFVATISGIICRIGKTGINHNPILLFAGLCSTIFDYAKDIGNL